MKKGFIRSIKDFIFFPIRIFFEHDTVRKFSLTSLQDERFNVCLPYVKGKVLDIGCGKGNKFIKKLGYGIGLDPYFKNDANIIAKAEKIPFADKEFQTITIMVSLRYVEDKPQAFREINRVLDDNGLVLILENHPLINKIRHSLIWWNPYKGMEKIQGITKKEIINLAATNKFKLVKVVRYIYGLGAMYILAKQKILTQVD